MAEDARAYNELITASGVTLLSVSPGIASLAVDLPEHHSDQLQTVFGGGKTHTLLAVYHLATGEVPAGDLQEYPANPGRGRRHRTA